MGEGTQKASQKVRYMKNEHGPVLGTISRAIIEADGLKFKDIDGSGRLTPVNDWRLEPKERAAAYVKTLDTEEKLGQLFISQRQMGIFAHMKNPFAPKDEEEVEVVLDKTGLLDETCRVVKNIFGDQRVPGTSEGITSLWERHMILRTSPTPDALADWINQLQQAAETCAHFVPVQVISNSRNENGELIFGMNDATGVFATWPGTLGIAAAARGVGVEIVDAWAECIRRTWDACGMKKGYMYMADVLTDPRWQRSYGTFGEDPAWIAKILERVIPRVQGSDQGVTAQGVSMTVKHFPGGGARENGFDPHYKMGQWNAYPTKDSLVNYHLPPFQMAVQKHAASIMPYYAKPSADKSAPQQDACGQPMPMQPFGFAYNKPFIQTLLRDQMGFEGYINSDTGIVHNMSWGVETLDKAERVAFAVGHAGTDVISGLHDLDLAKEAYARAGNDYYDTHPVPEGFTREQIVLTPEALDRAVTRTLTELFSMGVFENPYRDPAEAVRVAACKADWESAALAHRQSVVLLKNQEALPLTPEKLSGKKMYVEAFAKAEKNAQAATDALRKQCAKDMALADTPEEADTAILFLSPSSGEYFSATKGYLELDICQGKTVCDVDEQGCPADTTHEETTLAGADRLAGIARVVKARGGKVIIHVNITLAWMLGNVEPLCDALTAGFDTYQEAVLDVLLGRFAPVGKLPVTLPRGDEVLRVDAKGRCASPNDVPGYDKDLFIDEALKDENGKAYAYRDAAGNYYELDFGLTY